MSDNGLLGEPVPAIVQGCDFWHDEKGELHISPHQGELDVNNNYFDSVPTTGCTLHLDFKVRGET